MSRPASSFLIAISPCPEEVADERASGTFHAKLQAPTPATKWRHYKEKKGYAFSTIFLAARQTQRRVALTRQSKKLLPVAPGGWLKVRRMERRGASSVHDFGEGCGF
jgi:hypothetical protein